MICKVLPKYAYLEPLIREIPTRFEREGEVLENRRKVLKVMEVGGLRLNVKSYKKPHLINQFVYAYMRKTKAERSFEYARLLLDKGIGTPEPVAYIVYTNLWGVTRSFYISLQLDFDCEFRDLKKKRPEDLEQILRSFTRFTYQLHQHSIYFLDHSPGNTLIKKREKGYDFYLVDLNRIKITKISPLRGLRNFYRLQADEAMIDVIADEYAALTKQDPQLMSELLKRWTKEHDLRVQKRKLRKGKK